MVILVCVCVSANKCCCSNIACKSIKAVHWRWLFQENAHEFSSVSIHSGNLVRHANRFSPDKTWNIHIYITFYLWICVCELWFTIRILRNEPFIPKNNQQSLWTLSEPKLKRKKRKKRNSLNFPFLWVCLSDLNAEFV